MLQPQCRHLLALLAGCSECCIGLQLSTLTLSGVDLAGPALLPAHTCESYAGCPAGSAGLLLSTFALVFAAEWGDKSFLATIALAAASSPAGVVAGAVAGHGVATAIAIVGGSVLSKYLDEKIVQYVGGSLFLVSPDTSYRDKWGWCKWDAAVALLVEC